MRKRRHSGVFGISPRNNLPGPNSPMIELLLHKAPAVADILEDTGNTELFPSGLDIGGTTTNYWSTAGWWTPNGDHLFGIDTEAAKDFFRLDNITAGGLLFMCNVRVTTAPGSPEYVWDFGLRNGAEAFGYALQLDTNGDLRLGWKPDGGTLTWTGDITPDSVFGSVAWWINLSDINNPLIERYQDGSRVGEGLSVSLPLIGHRSSIGFALGAWTPGGSFSEMQENGSDIQIADMRWIRFEQDASAYIQDIIEEAASAPRSAVLRSLSAR